MVRDAKSHCRKTEKGAKLEKTEGKLHGVCTIALTPFTDEGEVDVSGIDSLAQQYLSAGVHGITVLGIMGEAHKLNDRERSEVTGRYIDAAGNRVPVIVGCSAPATRLAIERSREARELGAAAVMVAPPNNQKNLDLVYEHYREVAASVSVPVVIQDEPVNTGVTMPAAFLARLINELPNCRYLKLEEAPTTIKISSLLSLVREDVDIFGGLGGMYFYEELSRGASGIMTGFAYPEILVETYRLFSTGAQKEAQRYFFEHLPLIRFEAQLGVGGVGIRKEVFKLREVMSSSHVRSPAPALDEHTLAELEDLVELLDL
jgi:4-hydroxy-tetrahydrodipicolinate synthase